MTDSNTDWQWLPMNTGFSNYLHQCITIVLLVHLTASTAPAQDLQVSQQQIVQWNVSEHKFKESVRYDIDLYEQD